MARAKKKTFIVEIKRRRQVDRRPETGARPMSADARKAIRDNVLDAAQPSLQGQGRLS